MVTRLTSYQLSVCGAQFFSSQWRAELLSSQYKRSSKADSLSSHVSTSQSLWDSSELNISSSHLTARKNIHRASQKAISQIQLWGPPSSFCQLNRELRPKWSTAGWIFKQTSLSCWLHRRAALGCGSAATEARERETARALEGRCRRQSARNAACLAKGYSER